VSSQASELRERKIGITPFDCPRDNRQADRSSGRVSRHRNLLHGHGFIHAAVDDPSRLAYAEIHPD
jgi:hypothetical protein